MSWNQLLALDARLSAQMRVAERPGLLRTVAAVFAHSGDSWFWWAGLVLLWWRGNQFWRPWALTVLLSIIALAYREKGIKITSEQILQANPGLKPNRLSVGQKVFIPAPQP